MAAWQPTANDALKLALEREKKRRRTSLPVSQSLRQAVSEGRVVARLDVLPRQRRRIYLKLVPEVSSQY